HRRADRPTGSVLVRLQAAVAEVPLHAVGDGALLAGRARDRGELAEQVDDVGHDARMLRTDRQAATREPARSRARASAAATNSRKSGAGRVGRDLNSGWNCDATNQGWSGSSTISTRRPSRKVPLTTRPPSTSCWR